MATKKTSARRYSPAASKSVETELHAMKNGRLKSGSSGKTVTDPKQAIAIGLSEARKAGKKVPPSAKNPSVKTAKQTLANKTATTKKSAKRATSKKTTK